jgi:hypothetical protein
MTDPTDEEIVAYVDGEMTPSARAAFEHRLAEDPPLADRVARHRDLVARLHDAYPPAEAREFDSAELAALGLGDAEIIDFPSGHARRTRTRPIWATALAASLVGGILIGRATLPAGEMVADREGRLTAAASLQRALDEQPDGGKGAIHIAMTFRTAGGVCRTFRLNDNAGLGCRQGGHWTIPAVVQSRDTESHSADFRLAGDDIPPTIMAEVDKRIVGAPLDPAQVEAARRQGWK